MIPKHMNPYTLRDSTAIVSRSALNGSDDEEDFGHVDSAEHAQMVARLEKILKRTIDDAFPASSNGTETAEGASPRKKRRKVDVERDVQEDRRMEDGSGVEVPATVSFRLFSGASQPKPVVLAPKAAPVYTSQGPALEYTKEEAKRRGERARAAAVDFAWVMKESRLPTIQSSSKPAVKVMPVSGALSIPQPPIAVLERPKAPPAPPRVSQRHPSVEAEPSPHAHETSCCPVIDVREAVDEAQNKRRRPRRKHRERTRIQPTFWRPTPEMGGKSLGYAWGYAGGSPLPVDAEDRTRYARDTMRKAVFAS